MSDSERSPATHLRAHIGFFLEQVGDGELRGVLPVSPRVVHRDGSLSLGAIATMADVVGMRAVGHDGPMVTSHLAVQLPSRPSGDAVLAHGRSVRVGRSGGTSVVSLVDDRGERVGVATLTGAAIERRGRPVGGADVPDDFHERWPTPVGGPDPSDYIGLVAVEDAEGARCYRAPFDESLRNVNGVLHGGGACLIVEQAARRAAGDLGRRGATFDGLEVHFLAPGLTGPFDARVEPVPAESSRWSFVVDVFDRGRDDRRIALGVVNGRVIGT